MKQKSEKNLTGKLSQSYQSVQLWTFVDCFCQVEKAEKNLAEQVSNMSNMNTTPYFAWGNNLLKVAYFAILSNLIWGREGINTDAVF